MKTFDEACFSLQQQSIERGLKGKLDDFDVCLFEDGKTISIWAYYSFDEPLMAHFDRPESVSPEDVVGYVHGLIYDHFHAAKSTLN